jgi:hypothetical protein
LQLRLVLLFLHHGLPDSRADGIEVCLLDGGPFDGDLARVAMYGWRTFLERVVHGE